MSDNPILEAFRDIWRWQRSVESRLIELEKKMTEAAEEENQTKDRINKLEQLNLKMCDSVIKNITDIKILREIVKGKG